MFYTREEKQLLGRYFKYYREKENIKISDVLKQGICDYKTYKDIEEENERLNDEFYDRLSEYYGIDSNSLILLRELELNIHELYDACEWYDEKRIKEIVNIIKCKLSNKSNDPLIITYIKIIEVIESYYVNKKYLNKLEISDVFPLICLWKNELSSLLIEVVSKSNINIVVSYDISNHILSLGMKKNPIGKSCYAQCCINNKNYVEALEVYNGLSLYYENTKNIIRYVEVLMKLYLIYRDIDTKKAKEYTDLLLKYVNDERLPIMKKAPIYYNIAMYYYLNREYDKALSFFKKHFEIKNSYKSQLFICSCSSRMKKNYIIQVAADICNPLYPYIYYFELKSNKTNEKKLEEYIIKDLIKLLMKEPHEEPLWSMFDYEMRELNKKTRRYKLYQDFIEKFQIATKTAP